MTSAAVYARDLGFRYGDRVACDGISFNVPPGAVHGFLGPNGSGKSTLFKVLCTAYPVQRGSVSVLGLDLAADHRLIRPLLGVVFQSPALDDRLTVRENLVHGGHLFGLRGAKLAHRAEACLANTGLTDRSATLVHELSGGLRRRAEIAKALLPEPRVLLLDEPSTGLDPGARIDLWRLLRSQDGITVLFTTHLMEEAAEADEITILTEGRVVAQGAPGEMVKQIGDQVLEVACADPAAMAPRMAQQVGREPAVVERALRFTGDGIHQLVAPLVEAFGDELGSITLSHPSLADVYIAKTGHRFWSEEG